MAAPIELGIIHHIRLTVTDIDRSRAFYTGLLGFGVAVICSIVIFHRNASYLEEVVQGTASKSKMLGWLDRVTLISFGVGIIFTVLIGATAAWNSLR